MGYRLRGLAPSSPWRPAARAGRTRAAGLVGQLSSAVAAVVIGSTREALRPGGALEQLKVGEVLISKQDAASLSRWRVIAGCGSSGFALFAVWI